MNVTDIPRVWRTVRHLKRSQLWCRCRYHLEKQLPPALWPLARWRWAGDAPPRIRPLPPLPDFRATHPPAVTFALMDKGVVEHLNEQHAIRRERPNWMLGRATQNRLWTVTLHYHDWAWDLAQVGARGNVTSPEACALLEHYLSDWIERCGVDADGARELAWSPYAVASRIGNWARVITLLSGRQPGLAPAFSDLLLRGLWEHAAFLDDHLEWDLLANHLLRETVGLACAGRLFDEPRAARWLAKATELAVQQAREQVLADGMHFERSPMYHLQVMKDLFLLRQLVEDPAAVEELTGVWRRMADALRWLCHPDGRFCLLNDAAFNGACGAGEMFEAGKVAGMPTPAEPPRGGRYFEPTGLVAWRGSTWTVFFDVGPLGPDCQPGHAHADSLTVECSLGNQRLFVDPGTFCYDRGRTRRYDRSTSSHNTVTVDGEDSSEIWGIFRVGRRANPGKVAIRFSSTSGEAASSHDGFRHLRGSPCHARSVSFSENGPLVIRDRVEGRGRHEIECGFLLAPSWEVQSGPLGWEIVSRGERAKVTMQGPEGIRLFRKEKPFHPEFGQEEMTARLCWSLTARLPAEVVTTVTPL